MQDGWVFSVYSILFFVSPSPNPLIWRESPGGIFLKNSESVTTLESAKKCEKVLKRFCLVVVAFEFYLINLWAISLDTVGEAWLSLMFAHLFPSSRYCSHPRPYHTSPVLPCPITMWTVHMGSRSAKKESPKGQRERERGPPPINKIIKDSAASPKPENHQEPSSTGTKAYEHSETDLKLEDKFHLVRWVWDILKKYYLALGVVLPSLPCEIFRLNFSRFF